MDMSWTGVDLAITAVKISELPPATTLSKTSILPVVEGGTTYGATLEQVTSAGGGSLKIVPSGTTLDITQADPGTYYFSLGSTLKNGPSSTIRFMYNARVTVYIKGQSITLTAFCRFDESSAYQRFGQWEYIKETNIWSNTGAGAVSQPAGGRDWQMVVYPQP